MKSIKLTAIGLCIAVGLSSIVAVAQNARPNLSSNGILLAGKLGTKGKSENQRHSLGGNNVTTMPSTNSNPELSDPPDDGIWSGTWDDLNAIVSKAGQMYGFENNKNLGRNATMLVPANLVEMARSLSQGNIQQWVMEKSNFFHQPEITINNTVANILNLFGAEIDSGPNIKFTNPNGGEVVYNRLTWKIDKSSYMGTKNFEPKYKEKKTNHVILDVFPGMVNGNQYKYVGILYETDSANPDKFYIVDGQTERRLTAREVEEFPTTLSDMWKDMGFVCVENDAKDIENYLDAIGFSCIERQYEKILDTLGRMIARDRPATQEEAIEFNNLNKELCEIGLDVDHQIDELHLSDEERKRLEKEVNARIEPYTKKLIKLGEEGVAQNIFPDIETKTIDTRTLDD